MGWNHGEHNYDLLLDLGGEGKTLQGFKEECYLKRIDKIRLVTCNGGWILARDEKTEMSPQKTREEVATFNIRVGCVSAILEKKWHDLVTDWTFRMMETKKFNDKAKALSLNNRVDSDSNEEKENILLHPARVTDKAIVWEPAGDALQIRRGKGCSASTTILSSQVVQEGGGIAYSLTS